MINGASGKVPDARAQISDLDMKRLKPLFLTLLSLQAKSTFDDSEFAVKLQLIQLSDLENDFINPFDAAASINAWVVCSSRSDPTV